MNPDEYKNIRALIRGIHTTKNVSRPNTYDVESNRIPQIVSSRSNTHSPSPIRKNEHRSIPKLVVTAPSHAENDHHDHSHKLFNFYGLRRSSNSSITALNREESMGSLGHRALLQYIESNDLPGLKTFLDTRHIQVDDRDENGATVLMVAAGKGLTQFVRELLARGADVQAEDLDNWTALLCAAKNGHLEIVEILLGHNADFEHREMGGWTSLMWSSYRGHTEIVALLLEKGADIYAHGNYHLGSFLWAAGRGHCEIVRMLIQHGAKINVGDKYGTTALVWACRRGYSEIVEILLKAGANVDTAGMYSWTALLVSVTGGYHECVNLLLEHKPNINALDKDGMTALSIACREGYQEIASALIQSGAYLNIQDRVGDTPLINAVKGGHRSVVESLLKRHVDIDIQGKDRKTALYTAVEKGHTAIVKLLLASNPDLENSTKDGDTPLLRAVRNRQLEIVQLLLDKRAKVNATDRRGDTCLHIAMRARSKAIVEALLRNPKNSQLLYRANKAGETPYGLDSQHQKTILGQVFGARRLNTNEDSEGMLGYDLYSSALADVLSEPALTTPITVGLYAKWGSGKSFLLLKLRDEMINFATQWAEPPVSAPWLLFVICLHVSLLIGTAVGLATWQYVWGIVTSVLILVLVYLIALVIKFASRHYDLYWAYPIHHGLTKKIGRLRLIMQVAFCHPPGAQSDTQTMPIRFHFSEASSAPPTGEAAIGHMLASLYEAIENHYGSFPTRLYRAFKPHPVKSSTGWRWRRMCCIPLVILFELGMLGTCTGIFLLIIYFGNGEKMIPDDKNAIMLALYILGGALLAGAVANLHSWIRAIGSLFQSQGQQLRRTMKKNEGIALTALGQEVQLMTNMVKCLDGFTGQQSRLVGVVDALDSCDTERILVLLNAIQTLLSTPNRPFVIILAVDPHVIAKAAEANSRRLFTEGGIGGHDFLRNLVHLPVYLQNSGLRKVQRAQNTALSYRRNYLDNQADEQTLGHSASARRLSNASDIISSQEKLRAAPPSSRPGSKKLRLSESIASSIGSNLHRLGTTTTGGAYDLSKILLTDDYFSDVNPRSMRRLMNVIYITVRLLKAFQIDFSWYRLSSWINLTEQWPLRASMIVLEHDQTGDNLDDQVSLQSIYDKVRPKLSSLRESASLLELDRDERKLEAFLQLHKSDLCLADLRIFLPFTINLDPYIRKVLKEDQQAMEDEGIIIPTKSLNLSQNRGNFGNPQFSIGGSYHNSYFQQQQPLHPLQQQQQQHHHPPAASNHLLSYYNMEPISKKKLTNNWMDEHGVMEGSAMVHVEPPTPDVSNAFPKEVAHVKLSQLSVDGLIALLNKIEDLRPTMEKLATNLLHHSISGRVLQNCDLNELKQILELSFGHWEVFRLLITTLRTIEKNQPIIQPYITEIQDVVDVHPPPSVHQSIPRTKQSIMEKQVTLEEQMICGALQTLNEEAFEDVVGSERPSPTGGPSEGFSFVLPSNIASTPNSPVLIRRDSILKHWSSTKSDKRVSIKGEAPQMDLVNEKKSQKLSSGRPASLVLSAKGKERQGYKFVRTPSFDDGLNVNEAPKDENTPLVVTAGTSNPSPV